MPASPTFDFINVLVFFFVFLDVSNGHCLVSWVKFIGLATGVSRGHLTVTENSSQVIVRSHVRKVDEKSIYFDTWV